MFGSCSYGCLLKVFVFKLGLKSARCPRCWFKGADTSTFCIYLESKVSEILERIPAEERRYWQLILRPLQNCNKFMRAMYHRGVWLLDAERDILLQSGTAVINNFKKLATMAYHNDKTRWKLQPKLHMIGEILLTMEHARRQSCPSLNPLTTGTQIDEDFVGRVCTFSRSVAGKTIHERTMRKYGLALGLA